MLRQSAAALVGTAYGPHELIARGWDFRMQSSPAHNLGFGAAFQGYPWGGSQSGPAHIVANYIPNGWNGGRANHWAILPPVPNQAAGDPISVYMRAGDNSFPARVQIRYSPTGGTSTGSGPDGVGDFSQVLLDLNPVPGGAWQQYTATVPGGGRLAFRYTVDLPFPASEPRVEIDTLTVGYPCPLPPLPGAGQTVTWTLSGSPYRICRPATIPAGGTVVVQPGVQVNFDDAGVLYVEGTLRSTGTATTRATLSGQVNSRICARGGTVDLDRCNVRVTSVPLRNGTLRFANCTFAGQGFIDSSPDSLYEQPCFVSLTNCTFNGPSADIRHATLVMRNVTFNSPVETPLLWDGYQYLQDVRANNTAGTSGGLLLYHDNYRNGPFYVGGLSITNTAGAALRLAGGNYELGAGTVLQNCRVPVHGDWGAGLLPGTIIPATGNADNFVQIGDHDGFVNFRAADAVWAPVGVPYVARGSVYFSSATLTILPGVTVKLGLGADLVPDQGTLDARGLPGTPIVFERSDPGVAWGGMLINGRLENCVINGSEYGTLTDCFGGRLSIDNCVYINNAACVRCNTVVRKTRFFANGSVNPNDAGGGDFLGQTNPNAFEGNFATVYNVADARYNWWGDPSGPFPVGQGDPVGAGVPFTPWLTAPPDFDDDPPVVNILPLSGPFEAGEKVLVAWEVFDEQPVASQSVAFHDPAAGETVIASNLPGSQRSIEWTVPDIGIGGGHTIRVRATDSAGQVGWDERTVLLPDEACSPPTPTLPFSFTGQTFRSGDPFPALNWTPGSNEEVLLIDDNTLKTVSLGAALSGARFPNISTDHARLAVAARGSLNCIAYFFDGPFGIRPDARVGDAPPSIQMLSPGAGQQFPGCSSVPIAWSASDDESLRSFDIQASYNGGRTWQVIARNLPPTARSHEWALPASTGIADLRLRVIARDLRFQSSSSDEDRALTVLPNGPCFSTCDPDVNCDGSADGFDIETMERAAGGESSDFCQTDADFNRDGSVDGFDIEAVELVVAGGPCP